MSSLKRETIDFLVEEWLGASALTGYPQFAEHGTETFGPYLDLCQAIAEREFLPSYKAGDTDEPQLHQDGSVTINPKVKAAARAYVEAGLHLAGFPEKVGGMQMPMVVASAGKVFIEAANIAAGAYSMLSQGNTRLLLASGTEAQIDAFATPQIEGRALGTMVLSEPQAGSSLGDITTRAVPDGEDALGPRYRLFGRKMWISGGDHDITEDITHLVLAKIPNEDGSLPEGSRGISIFAVPKRLPAEYEESGRNDVAVAGLNHKMGYRGTTNCLLNFGEGTNFRPGGQAGAVGWRIGEAGQGLPIMFQMMNEARIGVGLGAASLAWRGYLLSCAYAAERIQGRSADDRKAKAQVPLTRHADIRRMLLAQKAYAEGALALCLYCARLVDIAAHDPDDAARTESEALLALLTPVAKTFPSEFGPEANSLAIQVHGGYGYTRDFDVEQLYRDNRLNPIHEGTTGIQALDLLGRKIMGDGGKALALLQKRMEDTASRAGDAGLAREAEALRKALATFESSLKGALSAGDPSVPLANATPLLFAFGHLVVGWLWLDQAIAAQELLGRERGDRTAQGVLAALRYFTDFELPKVAAYLAPFGSNSGLLQEVDEVIFAV